MKVVLIEYGSSACQAANASLGGWFCHLLVAQTWWGERAEEGLRLWVRAECRCYHLCTNRLNHYLCRWSINITCFCWELKAELVACWWKCYCYQQHILSSPLLTPSSPLFFFFLLLMADNSAPVAVFFPFDGGYSSYVSTCFESSCQLTLVYTYESHFATPI